MFPLHDPVREVHLIERVPSAVDVVLEIRKIAAPGALILDLSTGRVEGLSDLDDERSQSGDAFYWYQASDFAQELAETSRAAYVRWIAEAGSQIVHEGKNIKELFTYNGEIALWWFSTTARKGQITSPLRWFFYASAVIDWLYDNGRVASGAEWHLWVPEDRYGQVLQEAVGARGRSIARAVASEPAAETTLQNLNRRFVAPLRRIPDALALTAATAPLRRSALKLKTESARASVLIGTIYPHSWAAIGDDQASMPDVRARDIYLGSMPWRLRDEGLSVAWLTVPGSRSRLNSWRTKAAARQDLPDASPWAYLVPGRASSLVRNHLRWERDYRHLFERLRIQEAYRFGEMRLGAWIADDFKRLCRGFGMGIMIEVEQYRRAAQLLQPDAVVYRDEVFLAGRTLTAALKGRTHLIAVQHGKIGSEDTAYCFGPSEVARCPNAADHVAQSPMPDVFAGFGEFTRDLMAAWDGFPADRVFSIGGVRHDEIAERFPAGAHDRPQRVARLRAAHKLPTTQTIVLLCTQRAREAGHWFDLVLEGLALAGLEAFIAVKTHQYHGGEEAVRAVATRRGFGNYAIVEGSAYPLIYSSDLVVSGQSTIVTESRLLGTPVVSISAAAAFESYPYGADRICEIVTGASEFANAVTTLLLNGHDVHTDRDRDRHRVLQRHLRNDDAAACSRLVELILAGNVAESQGR